MRSDTSVDGVFLVRRDAGTATIELATCLDAPAAERATNEGLAWIKALRHMTVGGTGLRDRFTYRGDSLWWFIEWFLARERVVVSAFKTLAALEAFWEQESPRRLTLARGNWITRGVVREFVRLHACAIAGASGAPPARTLRRWHSVRHLVETVLTRLRVRSAPTADGCDLAVFVHAAYWRSTRDSDRGGDSYLGPVIRSLQQRLGSGQVRLVGIGPRVSPRARRDPRRSLHEHPESLPFPRIDRYASLRAVLPSLRLWQRRSALRRALLDSREVRRSAIVRGCDLWPLLRQELGDAVRVQLPWAARAMDEAGAALDALRPRIALTYAEAGAWGRALVIEARRRGVPVIGVQHGFIDRHVLDYLHEADEMQPSTDNAADQGYPLPDLTLVFDAYAANHLTTAGRFPASSLLVTGSPQLDTFAARIAALTPERIEAARTNAGAGHDQHVVLVVSKFTEIRPTFKALVEAVRAMPTVHAVVKCHPVETPGPYRDAAQATPNLTVLPADAELAPLLRIARLVVTVNSTVAFDAMALGIPSLTLGLPNNLSPFVSAGAMAGLAAGEPIASTLHALVHDEERRNALQDRATALLARYDIRSDGRAVQRTTDAVLDYRNRRPAS